MDNIIISVAPVSAASTNVKPNQIAQDVLDCVEYGASIVHLHVRDQQGQLTQDVTDFEATIAPIMKNSRLIIQASTGGVSNLSIKQRCAPLYCKGVEMASLNVGSVNLGDDVYLNPMKDVEYCSNEIVKQGIIPEFEVFELGMVNNIALLSQTIKFSSPLLYNIVLGHRGSTPATIDALIAMRQYLPKDALWGITHFGRRDFGLIAAAVGMGAVEVRIGFEDSYYIDRQQTVTHNHLLVKKLAQLINSMDKKVATPDEARRLLNIK